jgi:hypothetical protein
VWAECGALRTATWPAHYSMASMLRDLAIEGARSLKLSSTIAAGLAKDLAHKAGADKLRHYKDEVIYHVRRLVLHAPPPPQRLRLPTAAPQPPD